jgi:uncharacterized cupredoxin-like copper-binding protein
MRKRVGVFVVTGLFLVALITACGGSGSSDGGGSSDNTVSITETEMKFSPNSFNVKAGQKVTIKIENKGTVMHDFTIDDVGGQKISKPLDPGKSATVSFTAPSEPGTIQFYCSQPGHKEVGMVGTITVQ